MNPLFEIVNSHIFITNKTTATTVPTDYFWYIWKEYKDDLKSSGVVCTKEADDKYIVTIPIGRYVHNLFVYPENETNDTLLPEITKTTFLKPYQILHTRYLIDAFRTGNIIDGSSAGIGKTWIAIAVALEYNMDIFVVTPKSVIHQWKGVVARTGVRCQGIMNYEALKFGRSEFISLDANGKYHWHIPENTVIIWDEGHRCKNIKTSNAKMLVAATEASIPAMVLSATLAERPDHLGAIGPMLGLFNQSAYYPWLFSHGMYIKQMKKVKMLAFSGSRYHLWKIHKAIYPTCGHRVNKNDLKDQFPENMIIAEACEMDNAGKINKAIKRMHKELRELNKKKEDDANKDHPLTIRLRARQEIELLKVPTFIELTEDALEEGSSVIIFVNFIETLVALQQHFKTNCIIRGGQKVDERQKCQDEFQNNISRLILVISQAGSVGIDLHDTDGNYPRLSLISPTDSATILTQTFGRPHRSGGKSPVLQKIIFAAGTVEEKVCDNVNNKLEQMSILNDGDLQLE